MVEEMNMKNYKTLRVTQEGNVVTVRLHRPEKENAINMQMVYDLKDVVDVLTDANDVSVMVLRGSEGIFSRGIDLCDFSLDKPPDIYGLQHWEKMCRQIERLNKYTIAVVEGECIGGGLQLVLLCDARIAERKAVFQLPEVKLGFLPGMATFRLAKYVGLGRAKNIVLTGKRFKAEEAISWGILDQVYDPVELEEMLQQKINKLLPLHQEVLELARRLLLESYASEYEDFIGGFLAAQHRAIHSDAFRELILKAPSGTKAKEIFTAKDASKHSRKK